MPDYSNLDNKPIESASTSTIALSSIPLLLTFLLASSVAARKLYPSLSGDRDANLDETLPQHTNKAAFKPRRQSLADLRKPSAQGLASFVFAASLGLSSVLVELILCEISNTLNAAARGLALRVTLSSLLILSILVTPALEIHSFSGAVLGLSPDVTSTRRTKPRIRMLLEVAIFTLWLLLFWYIPQASILRSALRPTQQDGTLHTPDHNFTEDCLERIGIIGISLMASLSGFAAVSSLWQTFGIRHRPVSASDIERKEAGLAATVSMLDSKTSRIRALRRKMDDTKGQSDNQGFFGRLAGSLRPDKETQELQALQMEVQGLTTMRLGLSSSLHTLRERHHQQTTQRSAAGRAWKVFNTGFALYCAYRIFATSLSSLRRWWQPGTTFATSDPINNLLALLTTHYDSNLDRAAWSRQISFLLSGVMLLASFNAVLQTFRLFARFFPSMLRHSHTSLPLIISQVAGTYVVASALLLRSNLPAEVGGVISEALGAPLEGKFVEGWFESWFLVAVGLTAVGILVGRKVGGAGEDEAEDEGVEMGKWS
ncbi:hypothetical protein MBLNU230_g3399t1 [Neophaeotheca triangularis]